MVSKLPAVVVAAVAAKTEAAAGAGVAAELMTDTKGPSTEHSLAP